jgi:hypothetical protein
MASSAKGPASSFLEPLLVKAGPVLVTVIKLCDLAWPFVEKLVALGAQLWKRIEPYQSDFLPFVFGFLLLFFGGSFPLTIAAVEAFRLSGW